MVTCKDWPHIWLNEGFATYFEALYCEASRGKDEFQNYMVQMADAYLNEANSLYKRAIVTKVYKRQINLFDSHSYKKGGCILHMLRNYLGDDFFKKSLEKYVDTYGTRTAETDDLRKVLEDVSRVRVWNNSLISGYMEQVILTRRRIFPRCQELEI